MILRIIGSNHTGAVRAYDVIRMLSRDGRPPRWATRSRTTGGSPRPCTSCAADEPGYRRQIKAQSSLQESRHALAR
ncbi:Tn3 family transposase [Streptomyces scopuliridis]|uniref:Tn3 family transposase n=1 Tax=Streptomyces scopuliridis TaxID=452529 RepID=UPI0036CCA162